MSHLKNIGRKIGGREVMLSLVLLFFFYALIEKTGLFRTEPASFREIFHSLPIRIISLLLLIVVLANLICIIKAKGMPGRTGRVLFLVSLALFVAAIWTSIFTRFEGKTVKAESQSFNAFPTDYIPGTVYAGRFSQFPQVGITLLGLKPRSGAGARTLDRVDADILYAGKTTHGILQKTFSSDRPLVSDWSLITITDFGYMTKYVLYDQKERELESNVNFMKLYPPGAEDYFTTMFLGYVFYLQCFPDYTDDHGKPGSITAYPKNPVFNMRIVRNKDIVYNGLLKPTEKIRFDNVVIAVPEVKMWVEITFVRDLGLPVAAAGIVLLIAGTVLILINKKARQVS